MRSGAGARPVWPVIAAVAVPPLLAAAVLLVTGLPAPGPVEPADMWVGGAGPGPASDAPAEEVAIAHAALHDIGDQCRSGAPDPAAVSASAEAITGFALRYPVGRFPVDDESATAASLLAVTREVLASCAPDSVARIDEAPQAIDPTGPGARQDPAAE